LPILLARNAENQVQGLNQDARPSVDQKVKDARPMRFSAGTMPIPRA
jgi:hypothetical protein